jgi:hypothetical protein
MTRVLVCGGRDYQDERAVHEALTRLHQDRTISFVIHGACVDREGNLTGADRWAETWAIKNEVPYCGMPARWTAEGHAAGPIRNRRMLEKGRPDVVLATLGGTGTEHMKSEARKAGVKVVEVT